jgi:TfoX/Sxy family transcriptional regulator of competence genes
MATGQRKWEKSSPALIERYATSLPDDARVERRQMFGYPCAFVNGNMFSGLHEHRLIMRLAEADRARLVKTASASPCVIMGKAMREYVAIENALAREAADLEAWLARALDYTAALPPKVARKKVTGAVQVPSTTRAKVTGASGTASKKSSGPKQSKVASKAAAKTARGPAARRRA